MRSTEVKEVPDLVCVDVPRSVKTELELEHWLQLQVSHMVAGIYVDWCRISTLEKVFGSLSEIYEVLMFKPSMTDCCCRCWIHRISYPTLHYDI